VLILEGQPKKSMQIGEMPTQQTWQEGMTAKGQTVSN